MTILFSALMTIILLIVVVFAFKAFVKTIQDDIKNLKETYQFAKKMIYSLKENNIFNK